MRIEGVEEIGELSLAGVGEPLNVFHNHDKSLIAVCTYHSLLTAPAGRASYSGQKTQYRILLFKCGERIPFYCSDIGKFPANSLSFHPKKSIIAVGIGSYDGGYMFEGRLELHNWDTKEIIRPFEATPEVSFCEFSEDGNSLLVATRPWDEGFCEDKGWEPFETFFSEVIAVEDAFSGKQQKFECSNKLKPEQVARIQSKEFRGWEETQEELDKVLGIDGIYRGAIWDVSFVSDGRVAIVHDGVSVEFFDIDNENKVSVAKLERGTQLFYGDKLFVTLNHLHNWKDERTPEFGSALAQVKNGQPKVIWQSDHEYYFSQSTDGMFLARGNRMGIGKSATEDVLIDPHRGEILRLDLGHYDCFNHYLRIDGAPDLFFLRGTPKDSHERKVLCSVCKDGQVTEYWPLLHDTGVHSDHAMDCCGCYVDDEFGPSIVLGGKHYNPTPQHSSGFLYRRRLSGDNDIWRRPIQANVAAIQYVAEKGIVICALLDGTLLMLNASTGEVMLEQEITLNGLSLTPFSLDYRAGNLMLGCNNGTLALVKLV